MTKPPESLAAKPEPVSEQPAPAPDSAPKPTYEMRRLDFGGRWMAWQECSEGDYLDPQHHRADVQVRKVEPPTSENAAPDGAASEDSHAAFVRGLQAEAHPVQGYVFIDGFAKRIDGLRGREHAARARVGRHPNQRRGVLRCCQQNLACRPRLPSFTRRSPGRSGERPHLYLPVESRLLRGPRIMSRHTHPNDPDNVWPDDGSEDRAIAEARADLRAMMREQSESRLGVYPDGNPNVGAQHAGELRGQGAEPVSATDTVVDLLQRMLEAPTSHVRPSWKEAIRPVLRSLLADAFDKAKPEPVSAPTPTEAQIVAAAEATWGKFWQQNQSRTELASFARALGAEPVSARPASEPTDDLFAAANEIHGALDSQTYDEHRRADWDLPDDHEFNVTITAKQERALYAPGLPPGVYDMWLPDPAQESAAGASSAEAKPAPDGRETSGSDKPRGLGNTGPDEEENPKS